MGYPAYFDNRLLHATNAVLTALSAKVLSYEAIVYPPLLYESEDIELSVNLLASNEVKYAFV